MKVDFHFKNLSYSETIASHCEEHISKVERAALHPVRIQLSFFSKGREYSVEIYFHDSNRDYKAAAKGNTFPGAIDSAFAKLNRQLQKKRSRVKQHKYPEATSLGRLERQIVDEQFEASEESALEQAS